MAGGKRAVAFGAMAVGLTALEIILVGKFDAQETPVGAGIAVLATLLAFGAARTARLSYDVVPSWAAFALLVVRNVVRDTFVVFAAVARRLGGARIDGAFVEIPVDGGGDDPRSATRRALVVAGMSTSPNGIVLGLDRERGIIRVHQLVETNDPRYSAAWPL